MEIPWLANKVAFPAKIRTKVLIYLGNQKAKKAWSCNLSLMRVVLAVIHNSMVSVGSTIYSLKTWYMSKDLKSRSSIHDSIKILRNVNLMLVGRIHCKLLLSNLHKFRKRGMQTVWFGHRKTKTGSTFWEHHIHSYMHRAMPWSDDVLKNPFCTSEMKLFQSLNNLLL